jgi:hypothetical protein
MLQASQIRGRNRGVDRCTCRVTDEGGSTVWVGVLHDFGSSMTTVRECMLGEAPRTSFGAPSCVVQDRV